MSKLKIQSINDFKYVISLFKYFCRHTVQQMLDLMEVYAENGNFRSADIVIMPPDDGQESEADSGTVGMRKLLHIII